MICQQCGHLNDDGSVFCGYCGCKFIDSKKQRTDSRLYTSIPCERCGNFIEDGSDFCGFCGHRISSKPTGSFYRNDKKNPSIDMPMQKSIDSNRIGTKQSVVSKDAVSSVSIYKSDERADNRYYEKNDDDNRITNTKKTQLVVTILALVGIVLVAISVVAIMKAGDQSESENYKEAQEDNNYSEDYGYANEDDVSDVVHNPTPTAMPDNIVAKKVKASSYYTQKDGKAFVPDYVCDGDLKTAWNVRGHKEKNSSGKKKTITTKGVGEYLDFEFDSGTRLYSVTICPGFCYNDKKAKRFEKNYAPTNVTVSSGSASYDIDLSEYAYDLKKASKGYVYVFPDWLNVEDGNVRITINSVRNIYEEERKDFWNDCCISEISFMGTCGDSDEIYEDDYPDPTTGFYLKYKGTNIHLFGHISDVLPELGVYSITHEQYFDIYELEDLSMKLDVDPESNRIYGIYIEKDSIKTTEGIKIGDNRDDVIEVYKGKYDDFYAEDDAIIVIYNGTILTFELDRNGKVKKIEYCMGST